MEPKGSLPCSQQPTLLFFLSYLNHFMPFLCIFFRSVLVLFTHLCRGLQSGLFPPSFPLKPCTHFSSPHVACVPHPHESPQFGGPNDILIQFSQVLLHPCWTQISSTAPYFEDPQCTFFP